MPAAEKCEPLPRGCGMMNLIDEDQRYISYPAGNEAYIVSLEKLGNHTEAVEAMKGAASAGQMTPVIYDKLREHYATLKEKPATFEAWIASLKPKHEVEKIKNKLRAEIIDTLFWSPLLNHTREEAC